MNTLGKIVLAVVVLGLLYLAYRFIFKKPEDGTACDSDNDGVDDGAYLNGECVKSDVIDPGIGTGPTEQGTGTNTFAPQFNSVKVSKNLTSVGPNPNGYYNGITASNVHDYNIQNASGSNPEYIHFTTRFDSQCPQYIWYKKWLYVFRKEEVVQGSTALSRPNEKNCYYKLEKSLFPSEFSVLLPTVAGQCPGLKLFISGIEYKYSQTITGTPSFTGTPNAYCIYKR